MCLWRGGSEQSVSTGWGGLNKVCLRGGGSEQSVSTGWGV